MTGFKLPHKTMNSCVCLDGYFSSRQSKKTIHDFTLFFSFTCSRWSLLMEIKGKKTHTLYDSTSLE